MAVHRYRNDTGYPAHLPGVVRVDGPDAPCGASAVPGEIIQVEGLVNAPGWTRTDRPKAPARKAAKASKTVKAVAKVKPAHTAPSPAADTPPPAGEED